MIKCSYYPQLVQHLPDYFDNPAKLQKSININSERGKQPSIMLSQGCPPALVYSGWGDSRNGVLWKSRFNAWLEKARDIDRGVISGSPILFLIGDEVVRAKDLIKMNLSTGLEVEKVAIPIFTSMLPRAWDSDQDRDQDKQDLSPAAACITSNLCQEIVLENQPKQETNKMKDLMNKVLDQNKDAVALAGKLSVGKAGNAFLLSQVTGKFPWYTKLFGAKSSVQENPLAKLAAAQVANALATHFAPGNKKVAYVADAMLQEAMVDLITNSNQLQSLITQLEGFAGSITDAQVK